MAARFFEIVLSPAFIPLFIFTLRVLNNAIGTFRIIAMNNGRRAWGFGLASAESLLFAYTASLVLTNIENLPNLLAYVLGFAVGGYVGMAIERQYLQVFDSVVIITEAEIAREIAAKLREANYGVTETQGQGAYGEVYMLRCVAHDRDIKEVLGIARAIKPNVFMTVEQARMIQNGFFRAQRQHER